MTCCWPTRWGSDWPHWGFNHRGGLDGDVDVEVPAGSQHGDVLRVSGRGLVPLGKPGRRGDLVLILQLVVPDRLDQDQRAILEQWIRVEPDPLDITGGGSWWDRLRQD